MEDIFSTSFDTDYHFLGFSKSELDMATASSGKVNEEIRIDRIDRKSCSRIISRSGDPDSKHRHDNEYKERGHRDKPSQEQIQPSQRSSSPSSSSSSLDSRQAAESRSRPSSIIYHAKSRKC